MVDVLLLVLVDDGVLGAAVGAGVAFPPPPLLPEPKGSEYWSSPALWASAAPGAASATASAMGRTASRRRDGMAGRLASVPGGMVAGARPADRPGGHGVGDRHGRAAA